jgi:zinc D-Ala-D-Ala carboxypeptidase
MRYSEQAPATAHRARSATAVALALAVAAIVGAVLGYQAVAAPSSSAAATFVAAQPARDRPGPPGGPGLADGMTVADGVVPHGVTVFDDEFPAVANLDPELLDVLREAATAAADDGVEFSVTSGWRSAAYQDQLLREAVSEYGSEEEAARWVATAETSLHVSGDAVDIGGSDATAWLSEQGDEYGLCRTYRNEPWHYELCPEAVDHGCPTPYADPTHDPRMQ